MQSKILAEIALENRVIQNAYSILMGNIYLLGKERGFKSIVITSCNPKEGKTSLSTALAITMAGMGKKTLLVDLDFRKGSTMNEVGQETTYGIAQYIKGDIKLEHILCKTNFENLIFLGSGEIIGNPMSYLCSDKLNSFIRDIRNEYDFVIFDTPALECTTDAVFVSSRVDATILVAKMGYTTIVDIKKAQEKLNKVNVNLIGIVLNKVGKRTYKKKFSFFNYFYANKTKANFIKKKFF